MSLWFNKGRLYTDEGGIQRPLDRFIMEEYLGRSLTKDEYIHHIDEDSSNDTLENLQVMSPSEHMHLHMLGKTYYLGKHHSEETKEKISKANMGHKGRLGVLHSEETKKRIGQSVREACERRRKDGY